jgi:ABC-type branched-subunit amino acid transport system ATPase component
VEDLFSPATASCRCSTDVRLEVGRGEIVSVVGANGAGKTTLLSDHQRPSARPRPAEVTFDGQDITNVLGATASPPNGAW